MNLKKKFVIGAASVALVAGMGGVAAPAAVAAPSYPGVIMGLDRFDGADRVDTSLKVAAHEWKGRPKDNPRGDAAERVYLAAGDDSHLVDMAGAGMLLDGPIVFVTNNVYVGKAVGQNLAKFAGLKEVVPIGGTAAVADSVVKAVADEIKGAKVGTRLAGDDRYATSAAIAKYGYEQSMNKDNGFFYGRFTDGNSNLDCLNFANGADAHLVDAMVAGTLDNCPTVLSKPDGKIPESVAELIKTTLPVQFNALGGTAAVPDSTIQDAWIIKTLANKWDTSYNVPGLRNSIADLEALLNPRGAGVSKDMKSANWMGLEKLVKVAQSNATAWAFEVDGLKKKIEGEFIHATPANEMSGTDLESKVFPELQKIYGSTASTPSAMILPNALKNEYSAYADEAGTPGTYKSANYDLISGRDAYTGAVKAAKKDLEAAWTKEDKQVHDLGELTDAIAKLSQQYPNTTVVAQSSQANAGNPSLAAVAEVAQYTYEIDKAWLDATKAQLASLKGELRVERDKIAIKSEWRLGGADRFETAQLIANAWAGSHGSFNEVYIANGYRMADNLAAGQLKQGPILLVKGKEASAADLPEFTKKVASNLKCWDVYKKQLKAYGVGGTAVLADTALQTVVDYVNTKSVCSGKDAPKFDLDSAGKYSAATANTSTQTSATLTPATGVNLTGLTPHIVNPELPESDTTVKVDATDGKVTWKPGTTAWTVAKNGVYKAEVQWVNDKGMPIYKAVAKLTIAIPLSSYTNAPAITATATPARSGNEVQIGTISNFATLKTEMEGANAKNDAVAASDFTVVITAGSATDIHGDVTATRVDPTDGKIYGKIATTAAAGGKFKVEVTAKGYGNFKDTTTNPAVEVTAN